MTAPAAGGGDTRDGWDCRICGGSGGKHDGASHDAYVADRPAWTFARPAAAPADDTGGLREAIEGASADLPWRVGQHYGIHIYGGPDGQTPIGTTHLANDATLIVAAVNAVRALIDGARTDRARITAVEALCDERDRARGFTMLGTDEIRRVLGGER